MAATRFDANGVEFLVRAPDLGYTYPEVGLRISYLKHTRIPDLYASCIILGVLASTAVALRCKVRRKTKQFGWDDYTIILSLTCFLAMCISIIIFIYRGRLGGHVLFTSEAQRVVFYDVCLLEIQLVYICTMASIKVSILLLYLRIFGVNRRFRWAVVGGIILIACWFTALVIAAFLSSRFVDYSLVPQISVIISGTTNLATDLIVLFFPIRMVWRLEMKTRTKLKLISLFLLGLFVCITSLIRIIYLIEYQGWDEMYESSRIIVWTVVECGLSIITASLPIIRLLFIHSPSAASSGLQPGSGSRSPYFFSRKKPLGSSNSGTRSWDKYNLRKWSSTTNSHSHDESQVDIVREGNDVVVSSGKPPSMSKDEEMNWDAIELGERDGGDRPVTNSKLS